ncbi:hypothetical protein RKK42_26430 [Klebsiella pneumoniae]|nr:hypothetical protein [Klebsiella pneumoniae]
MNMMISYQELVRTFPSEIPQRDEPPFTGRIYGIAHNGIWDWGQSRFGVYYEKTNNNRMNEGLSGGSEGRILADEKFTTNRLSSWRTSGEINIPLNEPVDQTLTVGVEWSRDKLDAPSSTSLTVNDSDIGGISGSAAGSQQ